MSEETKPEEKKAEPFIPDVGDGVYVVYWNIPDKFGYNAGPPTIPGSWEIGSGRILSVGKNGQVAFEGNSSCSYGNESYQHGSLLRFASIDKVFSNYNEAQQAIAQLKPRGA